MVDGFLCEHWLQNDWTSQVHIYIDKTTQGGNANFPLTKFVTRLLKKRCCSSARFIQHVMCHVSVAKRREERADEGQDEIAKHVSQDLARPCKAKFSVPNGKFIFFVHLTTTGLDNQTDVRLEK